VSTVKLGPAAAAIGCSTASDDGGGGVAGSKGSVAGCMGSKAVLRRIAGLLQGDAAAKEVSGAHTRGGMSALGGAVLLLVICMRGALVHMACTPCCWWWSSSSQQSKSEAQSVFLEVFWVACRHTQALYHPSDDMRCPCQAYPA
jgi:hypothetical protein